VKKIPDGLKPYQAIVNNIIMRECATVEEAIETVPSFPKFCPEMAEK
jgi:hypothetical protein